MKKKEIKSTGKVLKNSCSIYYNICIKCTD